MFLKLATALMAGVVMALAGAPAATADTASSENWAGYAAHRSGVQFTKVIGAWRQPTVRCTRGRRTYSAVWVGLGGYSGSSDALEQVGSELDCTGSGRSVSSAWYELVPAASRTIHLTVHPGDSLTASVVVTGHRVQLALSDLTTSKSFRRSLRASSIDVSSADWIVEAPSDCITATSCQTLPLADFGSATFKAASAEATTGHSGTIADRGWGATRIRLKAHAGRFVASGGGASDLAYPSSLRANGSSFKVKYSRGT